MILILMVIYLSETLDMIKFIISVFAAVWFCGAAFCFIISQHIPEDEELQKEHKFEKTQIHYKKQAKKHLIKSFILTIIAIIIPSQTTMLTMAGVYVGAKSLETLSQNSTFLKAKELLDIKLDELLEEAKDKKRSEK